jgi:hypothetical protein
MPLSKFPAKRMCSNKLLILWQVHIIMFPMNMYYNKRVANHNVITPRSDITTVRRQPLLYSDFMAILNLYNKVPSHLRDLVQTAVSGTGAIWFVCPRTMMSTMAAATAAPVESVPMNPWFLVYFRVFYMPWQPTAILGDWVIINLHYCSPYSHCRGYNTSLKIHRVWWTKCT